MTSYVQRIMISNNIRAINVNHIEKSLTYIVVFSAIGSLGV